MDDPQQAQRTARLSLVEGVVTIDRTDNTGSTAATLNMPVAEGQRVSTGQDGQAELEFEDGSVLRLTPYTSVSLDSLATNSSGNFATHVTLLGGLLYAELRASSRYTYTIDAAGDLISPVDNSTIRINLDKAPAAVSVLTGYIHVERDGSPQSGTDVRSGNTITSQAGPGQYDIAQQIAADSWDNWNDDLDKQDAGEAALSTSTRDGYAGDQGYGWSDLDANGTWYDVPNQGPVWQPNAALDASFDPYGYGSWTWTPGYGYVWASGYPWGWVPFRCGSWSYWSGFGWGWYPTAGCGVPGWGFHHGGVYVINIVHPPFGYHPIPLPGHSPYGGVHPILPVRPGRPPHVPIHPIQEPRMIAGDIVAPRAPTGSFVTRGGPPSDAALHRDYPVDHTTHQPVMGEFSSHERQNRPDYTPGAPGVPRAPRVPGDPSGNSHAPSGFILYSSPYNSTYPPRSAQEGQPSYQSHPAQQGQQPSYQSHPAQPGQEPSYQSHPVEPPQIYHSSPQSRPSYNPPSHPSGPPPSHSAPPPSHPTPPSSSSTHH
jgi:hypothetical protein